MCAIYGLVNANGRAGGVLREMNKLLNHRGPDDDGLFLDRTAALGHRRLSIIDLKTGHQPIYNEDQSICLVYNGEIYNFRQLRETLENKGHVFKTNTDSEVIVHSYEEWAEGCVERFRGMFAFAIWDSRKRKLFAARDRLGVKPLYYAAIGDTFAFASELKAFLALKEIGFGFAIDMDMARLLLGFSFLPENEKTLVKGIKKLPPAHILVLQHGNVRLKRYWSLKDRGAEGGISFERASEEFEDILKKSVSLRLISDVPIGVMLSGGLDSSMVAALAQRASSRPLDTFTACFNHPLDERRFARQVAGRYATRHHEIEIDPQEAVARFEEIVWYLDDLTSCDGGFFSTYLISEKIKKFGIKVILVGEGSDELLGGYSRFNIALFPFNTLPAYLKTIACYYAMTKGLPRLKNLGHIKFLDKKLGMHGDSLDLFHRLSTFELTQQLPNHLLMKVDKATMAHSIEARVPLLDHTLVEFVHSLPRNYKLKWNPFSDDAGGKYILRKIASRYLPDNIVRRKKRGFLLPISHVLKQGEPKIRQYLLDNRGLARSLFTEREIEGFLKPRHSGIFEEERHFFLWRLTLLEVWWRMYSGYEKSANG